MTTNFKQDVAPIMTINSKQRVALWQPILNSV